MCQYIEISTFVFIFKGAFSHTPHHHSWMPHLFHNAFPSGGFKWRIKRPDNTKVPSISPGVGLPAPVLEVMLSYWTFSIWTRCSIRLKQFERRFYLSPLICLYLFIIYSFNFILPYLSILYLFNLAFAFHRYCAIGIVLQYGK